MMTVMFKDKAPDLRDAPSSASLQWAVAIEHFRRRRHAEGFSTEHVDRDVVAVARSCERLRTFCESPIEHQLAPWLLCQSYGQWACGAPVTHIPKEDEVPPDADLMLIPQFAFARFGLTSPWSRRSGPTRRSSLECDGADFHQDARRDFRRDRYLARLEHSDSARDRQRNREKPTARCRGRGTADPRLGLRTRSEAIARWRHVSLRLLSIRLSERDHRPEG